MARSLAAIGKNDLSEDRADSPQPIRRDLPTTGIIRQFNQFV
jgi:hypothetical protein